MCMDIILDRQEWIIVRESLFFTLGVLVEAGVLVQKLALKLESWEQWACDWQDGRLKEGGGGEWVGM